MVMKALFLKFDSKYNCRFVKKEVKNGRVVFDDEVYFVDEARPFLFKGTFGVTPMYIIKWDKPMPASDLSKKPLSNFDIAKKIKDVESKRDVEVRRGEAVKLEEKDVGDITPEFKYYTPEMIKALTDMEVMKNLLGKKKNLSPVFMLIIGMMIGVVILYVLNSFGLFRLGG